MSSPFLGSPRSSTTETSDHGGQRAGKECHSGGPCHHGMERSANFYTKINKLCYFKLFWMKVYRHRHLTIDKNKKTEVLRI